MSTPETETTRVFYAGRFSYRCANVALGGFAAFGVCAMTVLYLDQHSSELSFALRPLLGAIFVAGIGGLMNVVCLHLLWNWLANSSLDYEVSSAGIRCGRKFRPWSEIDWIGGVPHRDRIQLAYETRGFLRHTLALRDSSGLTGDEFHLLMNALVERLASRYPHLRFD